MNEIYDKVDDSDLKYLHCNPSSSNICKPVRYFPDHNADAKKTRCFKNPQQGSHNQILPLCRQRLTKEQERYFRTHHSVSLLPPGLFISIAAVTALVKVMAVTFVATMYPSHLDF